MDVQAPTEADHEYLRRCVDVAAEALAAGDEPFGSLLVGEGGEVLFEDRNHVAGGDATQHPEFAIARWAAENVTPEARRSSTVYTSGEHCPMCSAAHAWVGLGRIVYGASSEQLTAWRSSWGAAPGPVASLPIGVVAPGTPVAGPDPRLEDEIRSLHRQHHDRQEASRR
jgi:tRNA(Arg) A34 adenosine deaminase TadA